MIGSLGKPIIAGAALIALLCGLNGAARGADDAESLARLVPATAGLCVEIRDLAGAVHNLQHGELFQRASKNPLLRARLAPAAEVKRGLALRDALLAQLGVTDEQASQLFSDQLLLAIWPEKSPGQSGPGLLIQRCADEPLLQRVVRNIIDHQRQAGRLAPTREFASHGRSTEIHTINTNRLGAHVCLAIVGKLAIVATDDKLLEEAIAAEGDLQAASLANLPAYRAASARLNPAAPLRMFLNPRQWDGQMHARPRPESGRKASVHDAILGLWDASDYVSASLEVADALKLEIFLGCQHSRLSPALRAVLASTTGPAQLSGRLPEECLAALVGRLDFGRVLQELLASGSLEKYATRPGDSLAWAAGMALAGSMGPDFNLAIVAPSAKSDARKAPIDWILSSTTHAIEPGGKGPASATWFVSWLRETLRISAASAKAHGREPPVEVATLEQAGVQLTRITGAVPLPTCRNLYLAQDDDWLWLGNSAGLTALAAGGRFPSSPGNRRAWALHNPRLPAPSDLLLLDIAAMRQLSATWFPIPPGGKLAELVSLATLADALLIEVQCDAAVTAISLQIACD